MTGARYDRRISRGRSYIRRTYAERKFPRGGPGRYLIAAAVCKAPIETMLQTLCEIEKPGVELLSVFARRTSGQPRQRQRRRVTSRSLSLSKREVKIECADKSSIYIYVQGGTSRGRGIAMFLRRNIFFFVFASFTRMFRHFTIRAFMVLSKDYKVAVYR